MVGGTASPAFRAAREHERELNERQREVLGLIERGHTNREIADLLGLSVDGAKWNVSEILGKLGLATREEAAEYWRWRNRGVWGRVRALLGAPLVKVVGAGATAIAAIGVVSALLSEDEPPVSVEPLRPFYLEASITVWSDNSIGTQRSGSPNAASVESKGVIRWWWQDRDHFRWEYEQLEPEQDMLRVIGDGHSQWTIRDPENIYIQEALPDWPDGIQVRPISISAMVGPIAVSDELRGLDGILRYFNEIGRGDWGPKVVREDRFLGRPVTVIEMPGGTSSTTRTNPDTGETEHVDTKEGRMELWVDVERTMVLKHILDSGGQAFEVVVTSLDYDANLPGERFVFDVRPEALKVDRTALEEWVRAHAEEPRGYLQAKTIVRGYRHGGGGESRNADNEVLSVTMNFYGPNGESLTVVQERKTFPVELREGERVAVRGREAYAARSSVGWQTLAWEEGSLTVVIEAEAAPLQELVAMAESMVLVE